MSRPNSPPNRPDSPSPSEAEPLLLEMGTLYNSPYSMGDLFLATSSYNDGRPANEHLTVEQFDRLLRVLFGDNVHKDNLTSPEVVSMIETASLKTCKGVNLTGELIELADEQFHTFLSNVLGLKGPKENHDDEEFTEDHDEEEFKCPDENQKQVDKLNFHLDLENTVFLAPTPEGRPPLFRFKGKEQSDWNGELGPTSISYPNSILNCKKIEFELMEIAKDQVIIEGRNVFLWRNERQVDVVPLPPITRNKVREILRALNHSGWYTIPTLYDGLHEIFKLLEYTVEKRPCLTKQEIGVTALTRAFKLLKGNPRAIRRVPPLVLATIIRELFNGTTRAINLEDGSPIVKKPKPARAAVRFPAAVKEDGGSRPRKIIKPGQPLRKSKKGRRKIDPSTEKVEVPKATFAARQVKKPAPKQPIEVIDVDSSDLDSSSEIDLTGEETIDLTDD